MSWYPGQREDAVTTPEELVMHLREAGAERVFVSRRGVRNETLEIVTTYAVPEEEEDDDDTSRAVRESITQVLETIGTRVRFDDRDWPLEWSVEPVGAEASPDLVVLYDRRVERHHGEGFNLWNLRYVYEEARDADER